MEQSANKATKHDKIKQLLTIITISTSTDKVIDEMLGMILRMSPELDRVIDTESINKFKDEVDKASVRLNGPMVAFYDENYTEEEIDQLLAFYDTPLGTKIFAMVPKQMQTLSAVHQEIGKQVSEAMDAFIQKKMRGF